MARKTNGPLFASRITATPSPVQVSVAWLAREMRDNPRLRLVDVSRPSTGGAPTRYLPNAARIDFDALFASGAVGVPDPLLLAAMMSQAGAGDDDTIVVCDDGHGTRADQLAGWLRRYGHENAYYLLGGKAEWDLRGMKLVSKAATPNRSSYTVKIDDSALNPSETATRPRNSSNKRAERRRAA